MFDSPRPLLAARSGGRADRPARSRVCDLPSETAKPSGSWATAAAGERDGRPRRVKLSDVPADEGEDPALRSLERRQEGFHRRFRLTAFTGGDGCMWAALGEHRASGPQ